MDHLHMYASRHFQTQNLDSRHNSSFRSSASDMTYDKKLNITDCITHDRAYSSTCKLQSQRLKKDKPKDANPIYNEQTQKHKPKQLLPTQMAKFEEEIQPRNYTIGSSGNI